MKIGFIHPTSPMSEGSGATQSATQIAQSLGKKHDVVVYSLEQGGDVSARNYPFDTEYLDLPDRLIDHYPSQATAAVRNRLTEFEQFDIVHSYAMECFPAVADISEQNLSSTILTLNAYYPVCPKNDLMHLDTEECETNGLLRCIGCGVRSHLSRPLGDVTIPYLSKGKRVFEQAHSSRFIQRANDRYDDIDAFTALAHHMKDSYAAFDFPTEKITVVPSILDESFDREHDSDFTNPFELLFVGQFRPEKGVEQLPAVLRQLNERGEKTFRLTLVGYGELEGELKRQIQAAGVEDFVDFRGLVPNEELPELYATHDLFVYPGRWDEPLTRTLIEAFGTGTPVVATDVADNAEIIGEAGATTDKAVADMVDTIYSITNPETLRSCSQAAHDNTDRYRKKTVIQRFEELYRTVL